MFGPVLRLTAVSCLPFTINVKTGTRTCLAVFVAAVMSASTWAQQPTNPNAEVFEKRVKEYVKLRESIEAKMPKLSKEAKAEEIETHKKQLQESVRAARA